MLPFFRPDPAWQRRKRRSAATEQEGEASAAETRDSSAAVVEEGGHAPLNMTARSGRTHGAAVVKMRTFGSTTEDSDSYPPSATPSSPVGEEGGERRAGSPDASSALLYFDPLTMTNNAREMVEGDEGPLRNDAIEPQATNHTNSNNTYSPSDITAAQLEWLSHPSGSADPTSSATSSSLPVPQQQQQPPPQRPTTPLVRNTSGNSPPPPPPLETTVPLSPSQVGPSFPMVIPPHQVEDETIVNSALAEAWFARRRDMRLQQMMAYNPATGSYTPPSTTNNNSNHNVLPPSSSSLMMMDPRTGGFQQQQQQQQQGGAQPPSPQHHHHHQAVLVGPVDVDSGILVEAQPAPTAQAVMLRNPFDPAQNPPSPMHHQFVSSMHHHHQGPFVDNSDSATVVSKPNSLASATTSDMTPIASNVQFPTHPKYAASMNSSYAASSSSVAYSYPVHPRPSVAPENAQASSSTTTKGFWAVCCGNPSSSSSNDRNSCKGFLDVRTYHGKLAILLVTVLVLAIATMVVSATMTFQGNKSGSSQASSVQGQGGDGTVPTAAPSILVIPSTMAPSPEPTASPTTAAPTRGPTLAPTVPPMVGPTVSPTTAAPSPAPTTAAPVPTHSPTARPTDSLDEFDLPRVATIPGPDRGSHFGSSVALSTDGRVLAVGAPEYMGRRGEVRVFLSEEDNDEWEILAILQGDLLVETFGVDVALSRDGSILAVGAPGINGTVYTFAFNPSNDLTTRYVPISHIRNDEPSSAFGESVALSEDGFRLVVGAPYSSTDVGILNGQVRVYELDGDNWEPMGDSLEGDTTYDWLGAAVDISGDGSMVVASAPRNRSKKGYVRTWTWDGVGMWNQTGPDITNNVRPAFSTDRFGHSIALSVSPDTKRPRVAIGSPWKIVSAMRNAGVTLVYEFNDTQWNPLGEPVTESPAALNMENGNAVDLEGGILVVGIPGYNSTGAVALYRYLDGEWVKRSELIEGDVEGDDFGVSLATRRIPETDGFALLVGALMHGNNGDGSVMSYVKEDT